MNSNLTPEMADLILQEAPRMQLQLRLILTGLDGLPISVLDKFCEGLVKMDQAAHLGFVQETNKSVIRLTNRLQNCMNSLQQVKSNGSGLATRQLGGEWVGNALRTIKLITDGLHDKLYEELLEEQVKWVAEQIRMTFVWIKQILDTMHLPRANFPGYFPLQKEEYIAVLRRNIPICIDRFNQIDDVLEKWKQIHGCSDHFGGNYTEVNGMTNPIGQNLGTLDNFMDLMNSLNIL